MKLLFDQSLSFELCRQLADQFPGSKQVRLVGLGEADDRTVWRYAGEHDYILVTLDADFAELATLLGPPPKIVWLRCGNKPTVFVANLLRTHAAAVTAFERDNAACLEIY